MLGGAAHISLTAAFVQRTTSLKPHPPIHPSTLATPRARVRKGTLPYVPSSLLFPSTRFPIFVPRVKRGGGDDGQDPASETFVSFGPPQPTHPQPPCSKQFGNQSINQIRIYPSYPCVRAFVNVYIHMCPSGSRRWRTLSPVTCFRRHYVCMYVYTHRTNQAQDGSFCPSSHHLPSSSSSSSHAAGAAAAAAAGGGRHRESVSPLG